MDPTELLVPGNLSARAAVGVLAHRLGLVIDAAATWPAWMKIENLHLAAVANTEIRLVDHAAVTGAQETLIFPAAFHKRRPPTHATRPHEMFRSLPAGGTHIRSPAFSVLTVPNGYVCNFADAPLAIAANGGSIIQNYSSRYAGMCHFYPRSLSSCIAQARYVDGLAVSISDDSPPHNYDHWMTDWLPRLAFLGAQ